MQLKMAQQKLSRLTIQQNNSIYFKDKTGKWGDDTLSPLPVLLCFMARIIELLLFSEKTL